MKVSFLTSFFFSICICGTAIAEDFSLPRDERAYSAPSANYSGASSAPRATGLDTVRAFFPDGKVSRFYIVLKGTETREGVSRTFHPNGRLAIDAVYKNGTLNGLFKSYYENGFQWQLVSYVNGVENGISLSYFDNGKMKIRENYSMGILEGLHEEWDENGTLRVKIPYLHGQMQGSVKIYDEFGSLQRELDYDRGMLHGKYRVYKNGTVVSEAVFVSNRCVKNCNF